MIKIDRTDTYGWEAAVRGMRNPLNSWAKSDSKPCELMCEHSTFSDSPCKNRFEYCIGTNDLDLMKRLISSGTDHSKFMRMITVIADVTAPLYWWKEYDTYKVGTVANSCSTMHKIQEKKFTLDDFSHEHLQDELDYERTFKTYLLTVIDGLNEAREMYLETKDKFYWWQMIQLLPSSYNQKRTVQLNYAVLKNIYHARKNHKLDEWHSFCRWVESLPHSELITM